MSDFETEVELIRNNALNKLRQWNEEDVAKKVMRNYLSEDGLYVRSNTKLNELLDERHRIALNSEDDLIRLKAIDSSLNMAAGNEKVVATQNDQYNFSDFLNNIEE